MARLLTAHFQVHALDVLSDGIVGGALVLACICELNILKRKGGHACITADHHITVQAL